jgi:hypothetical protein
VCWIDANAEVRSPGLRHDLAAALATTGHFFTTAGHLFPTPKVVRPQTLAAFGLAYAGDQAAEATAVAAEAAETAAAATETAAAGGGDVLPPLPPPLPPPPPLAPVAFASRVEVTSALMAFSKGGAAHVRALRPMHACCLDKGGCLWPPGSAGNANQRRDQSALNAALAALAARAPTGLAATFLATDNAAPSPSPSSSPSSSPSPEARARFAGAASPADPAWEEPACHRDKRWWAWAGQATVVPALDPGAFDPAALRVFSRRAANPKPYAQFVQRRRRP